MTAPQAVTIQSQAADFPQGWRIPLRLLALAAPIIASHLSQTMMSFVDFYMVSQLGTEAQAAVMPAGIMFWLINLMGIGVVSAVNPFVAQSLGRGRLSDCASYAWQALYLCAGMAAVMLPLRWVVEPFFALVGHEPLVQRYEVDYARILVLAVGPTMAAAAMSNFFAGVHRPAISFVAGVTGNVFNVLANYALIFGHWGMPQMGIAGAATGTVLASILSWLVLMAWFLLPHYGRSFSSWTAWRFRPDYLRNLFRIGLPLGVQFSFDLFGWTVFTLFLVGRFGAVQLAANNISFKFLEFCFMPAVGLGIALTAAVGRCIGAGRHDVAQRFVNWTLLLCVGYMCTVGLVLALFRYRIAAFMTDDPQVIHWAGYILICCAVFQVFDAMNVTFNGALRGAGDTRWPAVFIMAPGVSLFLVGGYLVAAHVPQWGSIGPWIVATLYVAGVGVGMALRYRFGPWRHLDLFAHPRAVEPAGIPAD